MDIELVHPSAIEPGDVVEVCYGYVEVATKPAPRLDGRMMRWYWLTVPDAHGVQHEIGQLPPFTRRIES